MEPLRGIRVLEFGSFITAPYAAMLLAEYGADVVKVERPGGDPFRAFDGGLYSPHFQAHNRHKRSLVVDYRSDEGRKVLAKLLPSCDVVLVNARAGAARELGLDFETLSALHPRLVYCSITGFGDTGPWAARPAFDHVGQAMSGWLSRFRTGDDARVVGPAVSDAATAMQAALGIMAALVGRAASGKGCRIDVNMIESTIALANEPVGQYLATRQEVPVYQRAAMSQSYTVTCQDGKRIGLHLSSPDKFWQGLCRAVDRPDWLARYPGRMNRVRAYAELAVALNEVFGERNRADWEPLLIQHDVPFAPERSLSELADDPQVRHLDVFYSAEHPRHGAVGGVHRPVRIDGERQISRRPPPTLGEHSLEILREAGLDEAALQGLAVRGIIASGETAEAVSSASSSRDVPLRRSVARPWP